MSEPLDAMQLTLKDKVNFPYILANQMLTFQRALLALEYSEREIRETVEGFVSMIPSDWKDDKFNEDLKASLIDKKVDVRPRFCGVAASLETCEKLGVPAFKMEIGIDYYDRFQACIDLLNRRGLISQVSRVEKVEGEQFYDGNENR